MGAIKCTPIFKACGSRYTLPFRCVHFPAFGCMGAVHAKTLFYLRCGSRKTCKGTSGYFTTQVKLSCARLHFWVVVQILQMYTAVGSQNDHREEPARRKNRIKNGEFRYSFCDFLGPVVLSDKCHSIFILYTAVDVHMQPYFCVVRFKHEFEILFARCSAHAWVSFSRRTGV